MSQHPFEHNLAAAWPPAAWQDVTVLLAVSGGADSVAMLRAMAALKAAGVGRLIVAHFNHGLRGAESDGDQSFVVELARHLELECETNSPDVAAPVQSTGDGFEAAARAARYEFLRHAAERRGARYVVTAHTADDQAETILHRIVRGTGIAGLSGMRRARPLGPAVTLIRPLLSARRAEVLAYLSTRGQDFREDSSNANRDWTRNRIRHELLPRLRADYNPGVISALLRLGVLAGEAQTVLDAEAASLRERCVRRLSDDDVHVDCSPLAGRLPFLVRETLIAVWKAQNWSLQAMGSAEWDSLARMVLVPGRPKHVVIKRSFPGSILAQKAGEQLTLTRLV